jgi:hypothetical protein
LLTQVRREAVRCITQQQHTRALDGSCIRRRGALWGICGHQQGQALAVLRSGELTTCGRCKLQWADR